MGVIQGASGTISQDHDVRRQDWCHHDWQGGVRRRRSIGLPHLHLHWLWLLALFLTFSRWCRVANARVLVAQMCKGVIVRCGVAGGKGSLADAEAKGRKACCGMVVDKVKSEAWHNDARPSDSGPLQGPIRPRGYGE
jgi:hypothetical protein